MFDFFLCESSVGAVRSRASSFVEYAMSGCVYANH